MNSKSFLIRSCIYLIILVFFFFSSGCFYFSIFTDNIGKNFHQVGKIKNKITNPLSDSVRLSALWVGHSTVILQMDDKVIITDPFLTDHFALIIQREWEAGFDISNLKKCNLVLVSHTHFDHLNFKSLKMISEQFPGTNLAFPSGLEEYLPDYDFKMWKLNNRNMFSSVYINESKIIDGIKVTSVFAKHYGGRYLFDGKWGNVGYTGYVFEYKGQTVFFGGDTGYDSLAFKEIGKKFKINLALISVGPCRNCDKDNGNNNHVSSLGAVQVLEDLKADYMIPIHFGTTKYLSDPFIPAEALKSLTEKFHIENKVKILNIGEQIILKRID